MRTGSILDSWMYHIAMDGSTFTYGCEPDTEMRSALSHVHRAIGLFGPAEVAQLNMPDGYR